MIALRAATPFFAVLLLTGLTGPARAADCRAGLREEAQADAASVDLPKLKTLHAEAQFCDPDLTAWLGRKIAIGLFNQAVQGPQPDEAMLKESLRYARLWQALYALGELADSQKDFARSLGLYQEALIQIDSPRSDANPPSREQIIKVRSRAVRASLLAPDYQAMVTNRDGKVVGLGAYQVRSVVFDRTPLPIQFEFGATTFTPKGAAAAADLARTLEREPPAGPVIIEGHTDDIGSDEYNMGLSQRRAEAVVAYLRSELKGSTIQLIAKPYGKSRPYDAAMKEGLTDEERRQLDRRVEIVRQ